MARLNMFAIIVVSLAAAVTGSTTNATAARDRRQSQYICGTESYRFYSDIPCNMYPVCANGGFSINVGCTSDIQCQLYRQNSVCISSCCCTRPIVSGITTVNPIYRDQAASSLGLLFALVFTIAWFMM